VLEQIVVMEDTKSEEPKMGDTEGKMSCSVSEFIQILKDDSPEWVLLLDVRPQKEFTEDHFHTAISLALDRKMKGMEVFDPTNGICQRTRVSQTSNGI
jgi:hypothetical protein